jgi:hypothetical protein
MFAEAQTENKRKTLIGYTHDKAYVWRKLRIFDGEYV